MGCVFMLQFIILILTIYLIYSIPILINNYIVEKRDKNYTFKGVLNKKLLTENEYKFYNKLKNITDKYDLIIFCKVRLADIIKTYNYSDFNKIRSKHIDFIICDKYTNFIKFIELDDNTHNRIKNKKNDYKKNEIFKNINFEIIRIKIFEESEKLHELDEALKKIYL